MKWLKRNAKTVISVLVILILIEAVLAWYLIERFHERYISADEAAAIALADAGLDADHGHGLRIRLKTEKGSAWYEIRLETPETVALYRIDAETGAILSPASD